MEQTDYSSGILNFKDQLFHARTIFSTNNILKFLLSVPIMGVPHEDIIRGKH